MISLLGLFVMALLTSSCVGQKREVAVPITVQSAEDEIQRISTRWRSVSPQRGLLSPPSPISVFQRTMVSEITLTPGSSVEQLVLEEEIQLRLGQTLHCSTQLEHSVQVRYGRKNGEAAVEIARPPISIPRRCDAPHPEPTLQLEALRALFVLRADTLTAIEPALDKRRYIPFSD